MEKDVQFDEFVKFVATDERHPVYFDRHWIPQFLVCDPCNVQYDYIAKVETIERDAEAIFKHLGLPWTTLPRKNSHGANETRNLIDLYSDIDSRDLQRLVGIYRIDMDVFGYSEPWPKPTLTR